jgi:hypothetical protein
MRDASAARDPDRDRTVSVTIAPALGPMSAVTRDLLEERRRLLAEVRRLREDNDDLRERLALGRLRADAALSSQQGK